MRGGPGRVLPSVIVGGLLMGGLALGAGVATAETSCTYLGRSYDLAAHSGLVANGTGCASADPSQTVAEVLGLSAGTGTTTTGATSGGATAGGATAGGATSGGTTTTGGTSTGGTNSGGAMTGGATSGGNTSSHGKRHTGSPKPTRSSGRSGAQNLPAPAVTVPAALPAGAIPAAPPAALPGLPLAPGLPGLPLTGGFAPSALAGSSLPGGLSSGLFGAGFGNPALLAGTPLGAAATSLYQPQADSAVTTVSHSEALATGSPRGIGTPTAIAAVALACVVAILVRSRILRRIAKHESMSDSPSGGSVAADLAMVDSMPAADLVIDDEPLLAA
jgi:hypothetical protein